MKKIVLFLSFSLSSLLYPKTVTEWMYPRGKKAYTLFYQGILSSQTHVTKYMGSRPLNTTTGEQVMCTRGIDVILKPFIGTELESVQLYTKRKPHDYIWPSSWLQLIQEALYTEKEKKEGIRVINQTPDTSIKTHAISWTKTDFGQTLDIENHRKKWALYKEIHPSNPTILWGVSRGAATTLNAVCLYPESYKEVKLIILEGCFDSMHSLIKQLCPHWMKSWIPSIAESLLSSTTGYKKNNLNPIDLLEQFPKGIPVLFVTSTADELIHHTAAQAVAQKLAANKKNDVYLLTLDHSSHAGYTYTHADDQLKYQSVVHTLYKKYKLPYISAYSHADKLVKECFIMPNQKYFDK